MKKYNHAYTIAFSIDSDNIDENVTNNELIKGLEKRIDDIKNGKDATMIECCGASFDTYKNE